MSHEDEKTGILSAIRDAKGNISRAAERLGIARRTLQSRMRHYSIAKGTPGRRKMKVHYKRHRKLYAVGAVAAGFVLGGVLLKRRGSSA